MRTPPGSGDSSKYSNAKKDDEDEEEEEEEKEESPYQKPYIAFKKYQSSRFKPAKVNKRPHSFTSISRVSQFQSGQAYSYVGDVDEHYVYNAEHALLAHVDI